MFKKYVKIKKMKLDYLQKNSLPNLVRIYLSKLNPNLFSVGSLYFEF